MFKLFHHNKIDKYLKNEITQEIIILFKETNIHNISRDIGYIDNIQMLCKFKKKTEKVLKHSVYNSREYLLLLHLVLNCDKLIIELLQNLHKDDYKLYYLEINKILSSLIQYN